MYSLIINKTGVANWYKKEWYKNNLCHRSNDLPAIEYTNNYKRKEFYKNGLQYYFVQQDNGTKEYYDFCGRPHNVDGPAISYSNGDYEYWIHGERHRKDGPAVVIGDQQYWFKFGSFINV